jgi:hypothetical protein
MMLKNLTAPPGVVTQGKKVKRISKQAVILNNNNSLGSSNLLSNHLISSGTNLAQKNSPLNQL